MKYPDFKNSPFLMALRDEQLSKMAEQSKEAQKEEERPIIILIVMYALFCLAGLCMYIFK